VERQFDLPEMDRDFLDASGLDWEAVVDGANKVLLIHNHSIPTGYDQSNATVGLLIPPGYPDSQIDMAYFFPPLQRVDGKSIGGLSNMMINGKEFQRWSRHRTQSNPWRIDVDGVASHLAYMTEWLKEEFSKR
jgi:hypothetical protein